MDEKCPAVLRNKVKNMSVLARHAMELDRPRNPAFTKAFSLTVAFTLCLFGCAPSPASPTPERTGALYDRQAAEIFDDAIEPAAAGLVVDLEPNRAKDPNFRLRVRSSDDIFRVRVGTLAPSFTGGARTYELTLVPIARLNGDGDLPGPITLILGRATPGYLVAEGLGGKLAGMTFVAFYKRFGTESGTPSNIHFRLSPDRPEVLEAIRLARNP